MQTDRQTEGGQESLLPEGQGPWAPCLGAGSSSALTLPCWGALRERRRAVRCCDTGGGPRPAPPGRALLPCCRVGSMELGSSGCVPGTPPGGCKRHNTLTPEICCSRRCPPHHGGVPLSAWAQCTPELQWGPVTCTPSEWPWPNCLSPVLPPCPMRRCFSATKLWEPRSNPWLNPSPLGDAAGGSMATAAQMGKLRHRGPTVPYRGQRA